MARHLKAVVQNIKRVYDGFFKIDEYDILRDRHDGGQDRLTRLNFERGHAVAILAFDPERDVVLLVNEFRIGPLAAGEHPFTDSLPAGMIDTGESPKEAARREMREETGQPVGKTEVIHAGAYVSPGGTSEKVSLIYTEFDSRKAGGIHGLTDEKESIETVLTPAADFIKAAEDSRQTDMKTVLAAYWLKQNYSRLKQ